MRSALSEDDLQRAHDRHEKDAARMTAPELRRKIADGKQLIAYQRREARDANDLATLNQDLLETCQRRLAELERVLQ